MVEIKTKQGSIRGHEISLKPEIGGGTVWKFSNIPYANAKRFEKPTPFGLWDDEVWDGTVRNTMAVQSTLIYDFFKSAQSTIGLLERDIGEIASGTEIKTEESTLFLTVYTPANIEKKRPVMLWIHGGGWQFGGAADYHGSVLAGYGDVVVVTICYRMSAFGFLFGNWGLFDTLESLKWVQSNIEAYGGDKNNVTIFGESAGAWSVECLLSSHLSTGLFHRAICQSGSIKVPIFTRANNWKHKIVMPILLETFGADDQQHLKSIIIDMSSGDVIDKVKDFMMKQVMIDATFDNDFFTEHPATSNFVQHVPVLMGFNSTECHGMTAAFIPAIMEGLSEESLLSTLTTMCYISESEANNVLERAKVTFNFDENNTLAYSKLLCDILANDTFFGSVPRALESCNQQDVYLYNLDVQWKMFHEDPYKGTSTTTRPDFCRSDHGDDLMMIFGLEFGEGNNFCEGKFWTDEEKQLSMRMMKHWSEFAYTGSPGFESVKKSNSIHVFSVPHDFKKCINDENIQKELKFWNENYKKSLDGNK